MKGKNKLDCLFVEAGSVEEMNQKLNALFNAGYILLKYDVSVHPTEFFLVRIFTALVGSPDFAEYVAWKGYI